METIELTIPHPDFLESPEDIADAAERAAEAVLVAQRVGPPSDGYELGDFTDGLSDLIANVLHLAEREGIDAVDILRRAAYHYGSGRDPEPDDLSDDRYH